MNLAECVYSFDNPVEYIYGLPSTPDTIIEFYHTKKLTIREKMKDDVTEKSEFQMKLLFDSLRNWESRIGTYVFYMANQPNNYATSEVTVGDILRVTNAAKRDFAFIEHYVAMFPMKKKK